MAAHERDAAGVDSPAPAKRVKREHDEPQLYGNDTCNLYDLPSFHNFNQIDERCAPSELLFSSIFPYDPLNTEGVFPCGGDENEQFSCNYNNHNKHPETELAGQRSELYRASAVDGQEICYGTIEDASIINSNGFIGLFKSIASPFEELCLLAGQAGSLTVYNSQGSYCGLLCPHIVKVLSIITQEHSLRFQVFVHVEGTTNASSNRATIQINIYGPLQDAESVGDLLSSRDIFLQPPSQYNLDFEYRNPQYYVVPEGNTTATLEATETLSIHGSHTSIVAKKGDVQAALNSIITVENVPVSTRSPYVSDLVKTRLLEHQLDGLSFMQEREEVSYCGYNSYGGILADEPGLGKSLTTLALMAGSLSTADAVTNSVSDKTTLLIVPTSLLASWQEQVKTHLHPGSLSVLIFHGPQRKLSPVLKQIPHIVLTTYSTLVSDWTSKDSSLYQKQWYRVILDEAHFIKDRSTKRFKAVCALETNRRWCLTGTPLQNKIDDLSGLFSFIRQAPFDDYRQFQTRIIRPLLQGDPEGLRALRNVLRSTMIRRTKHVLVLPPRHDFDIGVSLSPDETALYHLARNDSASLIGTCLQQNNFAKGFHIIQSILRQRQTSNHGLQLLLPSARAALARSWRMKGAANNVKEEELPVFCEGCNVEIKAGEYNSMFEHCFHLLCIKCAGGNPSEHEEKGACPICNDSEGGVKRRQPQPVSLQAWENELEYSGPSTKVQALLKNIKESQQDGEDGLPVKSIVFSSWVKMLYLVGIALKQSNINAIHYNGTLSVSEKQKVLSDFHSSDRVTVLLMSIGSGGVGLNLTAASHVHLMEPQWNPMVETQALDRVHRLGQPRPVKTFRYIAKSTFDESILLLQKKKLDMAELSLTSGDQGKADQMRRRLESLSAVFR